MKKQKLFHLIGVAIGVIAVIAGVVFMFATPATYSSSGNATPKDASFGADYYTYEYEATRLAATWAYRTCRLLSDVSGQLALYVGSAFILFGLVFAWINLKKLLFAPQTSDAQIPAPSAPVSQTDLTAPVDTKDAASDVTEDIAEDVGLAAEPEEPAEQAPPAAENIAEDIAEDTVPAETTGPDEA